MVLLLRAVPKQRSLINRLDDVLVGIAGYVSDELCRTDQDKRGLENVVTNAGVLFTAPLAYPEVGFFSVICAMYGMLRVLGCRPVAQEFEEQERVNKTILGRGLKAGIPLVAGAVGAAKLWCYTHPTGYEINNVPYLETDLARVLPVIPGIIAFYLSRAHVRQERNDQR